MLNEATRANLARKAPRIDDVRMSGGRPIWSFVELNVTELCNRTCVFCPRADPAVYPNQSLHMPRALTERMAAELHELDYRGIITLSGFGEPMLHADLPGLIAPLKGFWVEIVTNGDPLTRDNIAALHDAGVSHFVVSMYDGPEQAEHFDALFAGQAVEYTLRDRWHGADDDYGLVLTNRAGKVNVGHQPPVDQARPCQYLAYQLTVDFNGDVLLCSHDWSKMVRFGNLMTQTMMEVWTSRSMRKRRKQLMRGDRTASPCSGCNANGCVFGSAHAEAWAA